MTPLDAATENRPREPSPGPGFAWKPKDGGPKSDQSKSEFEWG
jgi:hypothetical protein